MNTNIEKTSLALVCLSTYNRLMSPSLRQFPWFALNTQSKHSVCVSFQKQFLRSLLLYRFFFACPAADFLSVRHYRNIHVQPFIWIHLSVRPCCRFIVHLSSSKKPHATPLIRASILLYTCPCVLLWLRPPVLMYTCLALNILSVRLSVNTLPICLSVITSIRLFTNLLIRSVVNKSNCSAVNAFALP